MDIRKKLVTDISKLSKNEHIEIFKIIKEYTNKFTINDNGVFINLTLLDDITIKKLTDFVIFCKDNGNRLTNDEEKIKNEINELMEETNVDNDENDIKEIEENEDDMNNGSNISLKKVKPKYGGIKAKIIKGYKTKNIKKKDDTDNA